MKITLTEDDITNATPGSSQNCYCARALKRELGRNDIQVGLKLVTANKQVIGFLDKDGYRIAYDSCYGRVPNVGDKFEFTLD